MATPYDRAVAFLTNGNYKKAIEEFTAAIRLDPNGPNAYLGRALAHRSFGDDANALLDENAAKQLGGAERSTWERIVNRAYQDFKHGTRNDFYKGLDPFQRKTVLLWDFTSQQFNGGIRQWLSNGYGAWVNELMDAIREIGTPSARGVLGILEKVRTILEQAPPNADQEVMDGELLERIYRCDSRYADFQEEFGEDIETWVEYQSQSH